MENDALHFVAIANELEEYIENTIPQSTKISKYGGTLFTLKPEEKEGQYCGLFIYKEHVQVSFSKGAQLEDPDKLLEGKGKLRRHVNFTSTDKGSFDGLESLLIQASKL